MVPVAVTEIPRIASADVEAGAFRSPTRLLYTFRVAAVAVPDSTIPFTPGAVVKAPVVDRS